MNAGQVAERYHRETNQAPGRLPRPGVAGFVPMDPNNRPRPFKRYPRARTFALPPDLPARGAPGAVALSGRVPITDSSIDVELLARLLFHSAGVTRVATAAGQGVSFRAAASAGNLHPIEVYVATGAVAGLDAGLYHFAPDVFALEELRQADHRAAVADAVAAPDVAASPLTLVLTGMPWRSAWKYGERGWRHVYWDAGTLLANLLAVADGYGLPARVLLGFVDGALCRQLGIDGVAEFPLAVITIGEPSATAAGGRRQDEPGLAATALSPAPVEFPLTTSAQQAGNLATAGHVAAWRARAAGPSHAPRSIDPPAEAPAEPIESVILRRGSTRRMRRRVAPAELLDWGFAVATRHVPADAIPAGASLLSHQLAVHAVRARQPGLYLGIGGEARPHHAMPEHDVRRLSRRMCLDQPLGGESAYTDFICAELDQVLNRYGDRGYRVAQLEAGVAAGRLQLAAFALDHGGTGLTFSDKEIPAAFDTRAACLLAVSIGSPAYRAKPGGPPGRPGKLTLA